MKYLSYPYLIILSMTVAFFSCEKNNPEFSCDPGINEYVKNNKKALSAIPLDEFNSYNINLQRAVFNSWDHVKKRDAWLEKFSIIKENEPFSPAEINHINKIEKHISPNYFHMDTLENTVAERSNFAENWMGYAGNELHWSDEYIAFIVFRLYTSPEQIYQELSEINQLNKTITAGTEINDCNCNTTIDLCTIGYCNSGNCNVGEGCGWLMSRVCDGTCY